MTANTDNPRRRQLVLYLIADFVAVALAFLLFTRVRYDLLRLWVHPDFSSFVDFISWSMVTAEFVLMPLLFIALSWLLGFYGEVMYKSRTQVVGNTVLVALICTLLFYLLALTNDVMPRRRYYYEQLLWLWGSITVIDGVARWIVSTRMARRIKRGEWSQRIMMIGATPGAARLARNIMKARPTMGMEVVAYANLGDGPVAHGLELPVIDIKDLDRYIDRYDVQALVLAPAAHTSDANMKLVSMLLPYDLPLFVSPTNNVDTRLAYRGFENVAGEPLVDVSRAHVPYSTANIKRVSDIILSSLALIVLAPAMAAIALAVKLDSKGPVFFRQRRVGYHQKTFHILKFRSMRVDAEAPGSPQLSAPDDDRVTRVGRVMRKYRLDELPNFVNVLLGQMALVGPRPERPYYVDQLLKREPLYAIIHSVKPGLTGWGMVKFGYAQTVSQMLERMRYDLLYVQNVTLGVDLKILFYTVRTVVTGRGI